MATDPKQHGAAHLIDWLLVDLVPHAGSALVLGDLPTEIMELAQSRLDRVDHLPPGAPVATAGPVGGPPDGAPAGYSLILAPEGLDAHDYGTGAPG